MFESGLPKARGTEAAATANLWKSLLEYMQGFEPCHHIKLTQLLPVILGAALVIAAIRLAGHALAPGLAPCLSFGVGAIVLSYAVFALMAVHGAHRWTLIVVLLIAIVAGIVRRPAIRLKRPPILIVAVCAPFFIWYLVNALAPEVQSDPNVYHLQPAMDAYRH